MNRRRSSFCSHSSEIFSNYAKKSLDRFRSDEFNQMFARLSIDSTFQFDPTITAFIENYRKLPLATRAKLEKWAINPQEVMLAQGADLENIEGRPNATFHGVDVAVRIIKKQSNDDARKSHITTELRAISQLRHPNIVGLIGACFSHKACMVVTESCPHGSLKSHVEEQSRIRPWSPSKSRVLSWSLDLARALNYLHNADPVITHGNIRPTTLLLSTSLILKVSGFGNCRTCVDRGGPSPADFDDVPRGAGADIILNDDTNQPTSPAQSPLPQPSDCYTAPELRRNPRIRDPKVDVFSAAMVICFLRTGRDPNDCGVSGKSGLRWAALGRVLEGAWAETAGERPEAAELQEGLEALEKQTNGPLCRVS